MLYKHITDLIGDTPLLEIDPTVHGLRNIDLYAKLEYYNPFGSVKDRIAWGMIKDDLPDILAGKKTIIEASSGNTAKALQAIAGLHGLKCTVVTNRTKVPEVKQVLQLLGAELEEMPGSAECPDPTDFSSGKDNVFVNIEKRVASDPSRYYYPSQYTNQKNVDTHYRTTGKEIQKDLGSVDYFFGGLGTAGSTRGAALYLKEHNKDLITVGIVSGSDDFIPGIRSSEELWEVGLFQKEFYDQISTVTAREAVDATLALIRKCGVLAGPTSGACYHATLQYLQKIDDSLKERKKAVFIVCDRMEWYLSYFEKRRPDIFGIRKSLASHGLDPEFIDQTSELDAAAIVTKEGEQKLIIDIRSNVAYRIGHIPGSINLPDEILEELIDTGLPFSKDSSIIVVCGGGKTSKRFAALLKKKGYEASSLRGGIGGWKTAGRKLANIVGQEGKLAITEEK